MPGISRDEFLRRVGQRRLRVPADPARAGDRRLARLVADAQLRSNGGNGNTTVDTEVEWGFIYDRLEADELDENALIDGTGVRSLAHLERLLFRAGSMTEWQQMATQMGFRLNPAIGVPESDRSQVREALVQRAAEIFRDLRRLYGAESGVSLWPPLEDPLYNGIDDGDIELHYTGLMALIVGMSPAEVDRFVADLGDENLRLLAKISATAPNVFSVQAGSPSTDGRTIFEALMSRVEKGETAAKIVRAWHAEDGHVPGYTGRRGVRARTKYNNQTLAMVELYLSRIESADEVDAFLNGLAPIREYPYRNYAVAIVKLEAVARLAKIGDHDRAAAALNRIGREGLRRILRAYTIDPDRDGTLLITPGDDLRVLDRSHLIDLLSAVAPLNKDHATRKMVIEEVRAAFVRPHNPYEVPADVGRRHFPHEILDAMDRGAFSVDPDTGTPAMALQQAVQAWRTLQHRHRQGPPRDPFYGQQWLARLHDAGAWFAFAYSQLSADDARAFVAQHVEDSSATTAEQSFDLLLKSVGPTTLGPELLARMAANSPESRLHRLALRMGSAVDRGVVSAQQYVRFARALVEQDALSDDASMGLIRVLVQNLGVQTERPEGPAARDDPDQLFHPSGALIAELVAKLGDSDDGNHPLARQAMRLIVRSGKLEAIARSATVPTGRTNQHQDNLLGLNNPFFRRTYAHNDVRSLVRLLAAFDNVASTAPPGEMIGERAEMLAATMEAIRVGVARHKRRALGLAGIDADVSALVNASLRMLLPDRELDTFKMVQHLRTRYGDGRALGLLHTFAVDLDAWIELDRTDPRTGDHLGEPLTRPPYAPGEHVGRLYELHRRVTEYAAGGVGPVEFFWKGTSRVISSHADPRYISGTEARKVIAYLKGAEIGGWSFTLRSVLPVLRELEVAENTRIRMTRELLSFITFFSDSRRGDYKRWGALKEIIKAGEILSKLGLHVEQNDIANLGLARRQFRMNVIGQWQQRIRESSVLPWFDDWAQDRFGDEESGNYDLTRLRSSLKSWRRQGAMAGSMHLADSFDALTILQETLD